MGISVWERYTGPYTDEMRPFVDQMMNNRIACGWCRLGCAAGITASSACPTMPVSRQHRAVPDLTQCRAPSLPGSGTGELVAQGF